MNQSERDAIIRTLDENKKQFINEQLKRGKKTIFSNVLAEWKASSVTEGIEEIADSWVLIDFLDAGETWKETSDLFCDCGKLLRYQYIVVNNQTGDTHKFGETHFEQHTNLPAQLVRDIIKGFENIDYEMDEILEKIKYGWNFRDINILIPDGFCIPQDIKEHFENDIPLLDRQINRLKAQIKNHINELEQQKRQKHIEKQQEEWLRKEEQSEEEKAKERELQKAKEQQLIEERNITIRTIHIGYLNIELSKKYMEAIILLLNQYPKSTIDVLSICRYLIEDFGASNDTYQGGKPRIFPHIALFLDVLVREDVLKLKISDLQNRHYIIQSGAQICEENVDGKQLSMF
ncbi:DUF3895 domain-containing protein [Bacillus sp. SCS-151]|uniref:DUF3895 domain-containing protein n=1 Tax=Nanhaiella sioensis TaxID=3115293 RepID=UPI00397DE1FD